MKTHKRKKLRTDHLAGDQHIQEGPTLTGMIIKGRFTGRERHEKIGQCPVALEYNIQDVVALLCVPITW